MVVEAAAVALDVVEAVGDSDEEGLEVEESPLEEVETWAVASEEAGAETWEALEAAIWEDLGGTEALEAEVVALVEMTEEKKKHNKLPFTNPWQEPSLVQVVRESGELEMRAEPIFPWETLMIMMRELSQ